MRTPRGAGHLEPDRFADESVLDNAFSDVSLSVFAIDTQTVVDSIVSRAAAQTSTGTNVFSGLGDLNESWSALEQAFRIDFNNPVIDFNIDVIGAANFSGRANMRVFDSDDVLLALQQTGPLPSGDIETLSYSSPGAEIDYVVVSGLLASVNFDQIVFTELI